MLRRQNKMATSVHRVTMFKIPQEEDRQKLLEQYKVLSKTHEKDGKPYILSVYAGPAEEDQRSQGYTFVCKTEFANMDDMKFYDEDCEAHLGVKKVFRTLTVEGLLTVYFKPQAIGGAAL
ncbi:Fusaristatin A biosynthesis cluster protein [Paramyrothecium foliicola]|nr:Fusaristatin A biosynthesis cluster protein [Paramyrothecium foliicola]